MLKQVTVHLDAGKLKFSSGHFTIFSKTERESLHGHNYTVKAQLKMPMTEPGITADYRAVEEKFIALCHQLNWRTLIAEKSPYLTIVSDATQYHITFNHETMSLLKNDVVLLPLNNITLETLSQWFIDRITSDAVFFEKYSVSAMTVLVHNGPHHAAEANWSRNTG